MIKAVLFDFDGVICQTETYRLDRRAAYLRSLGLKVDMRQIYQLAGGTSHNREAMMDKLFADQEIYWNCKEKVLQYRWPEAPYRELVTPGIAQTMQILKQKGILIGVASNSSEAVLETGLNECQVRQYVDVIVSGWDTQRRKPDPYVYLQALAHLHVTSGQCIVVEDSKVGIQAGKAAGCKVVALKDRDGLIDQRESDVVIERMEQLFDYLQLWE